MPISKKNFIEEKFEIRGRGGGGKVFLFLKENKSSAFLTLEIATILKNSVNNVNASLSYLKNRKLVEHKSPYWMYKEESKNG